MEAVKKKDLRDSIDKKVFELPMELQEEIIKQFEVINTNRIKEATIQEWNDFIKTCLVPDYDETYLWEIFASNKIFWEINDICAVRVNVLDLLNIKHETIKDMPFLTMIDYRKPALIIDADALTFCSGYILLQLEQDDSVKLVSNRFYTSNQIYFMFQNNGALLNEIIGGVK